MKLIIDAYNVLHAWRSGPMPEGPRELNALSQMITRSRFSAADTEIVCDGAAVQGVLARNRGVHVRFAGAGKDADSLIESMVLRHKGSTLHVVSSDRRVQRAARKRRGVAHTADAFLATLVRDVGGRSASNPAMRLPKPEFALDLPLHPVLIRAWRDEFAIDWGAAGVPSQNPLIAPTRPTDNERNTDLQSQPSSRTPQRSTKGGGKDTKLGRNTKPAINETHPLQDPELKDILEHYRGSLDPSDLDMSKWLDP